MPIEAPSHTHPVISSITTHSEFVLCQDFVSRPASCGRLFASALCGRFGHYDGQFQILHTDDS
jgi:hypothetical protein